MVFGVVGLIAYSRALERASLARVTAILLVTEVTVPGLAGIILLGDSVRPGWWAAMAPGSSWPSPGSWCSPTRRHSGLHHGEPLRADRLRRGGERHRECG